MPGSREDLRPLFEPDSVAVVGASPDSWYSSQLMDNLIDYGFEGAVYPVNPSRDEAWGRHCYDRIGDVPEVVDLAVVSVPRQFVVDVVREAGEMGVPAALVITAGFAEADEEGRALQAELADVAEVHDVRVCGPNCIGLANALAETVLTSTCSRKPEPGTIGLVSQSGALAFTTFYERAADEDVHFAHIVSTGNEADQSLVDYIEFLAGEPSVNVICTYIEGVDDPGRFLTIADRAGRAGTPVVAVKIGQSDVAEAATMSHTGSLTGNDDIWDAAFEQVGVQRVPDIPDLLNRASAHATYDPPDSNRVCVASTSGGMASLLADLAAERDLELPDIASETEAALLDMGDLLTFGEMHNPADIRGYGADVLPEIADILFADDRFDAYVFAIGLPAVDERAESIADDVLAVAERATDPTLFLWTGRKEPADRPDPQPYERVRAAVPLFYDPGRCMDALASLVKAEAHRRDVADQPSREDLLARDSHIPALDLPEGTLLGWVDASRCLEAAGVPLVETRLTTSRDEAVAAAADLGGPVAMKVDSADVPHRAAAGGIELDVDGDVDVGAAYDRILAAIGTVEPDADMNGVLVQPMADAGVEALVGATRDEAFGPVVTVGTGGSMVETIADSTIRVPPMTSSEARDAIAGTGLEARCEAAGVPDERLDDLAEMAVAVGDLARAEPSIAELDLNPVILTADRLVAVDALVRTI